MTGRQPTGSCLTLHVGSAAHVPLFMGTLGLPCAAGTLAPGVELSEGLLGGVDEDCLHTGLEHSAARLVAALVVGNVGDQVAAGVVGVPEDERLRRATLRAYGGADLDHHLAG